MDDRTARAARRRDLDAELDFFEVSGGDELAALLKLARRLRAGHVVYGPLDVLDGRRWRKEAGEEFVDAGVYGLCELLKEEREDCATLEAARIETREESDVAATLGEIAADEGSTR